MYCYFLGSDQLENSLVTRCQEMLVDSKLRSIQQCALVAKLIKGGDPSSLLSLVRCTWSAGSSPELPSARETWTYWNRSSEGLGAPDIWRVKTKQKPFLLQAFNPQTMYDGGAHSSQQDKGPTMISPVQINYLTEIRSFFQIEAFEPVFATNMFVEFGYKLPEIDKNENADIA
ncbi:hypothetical protein BTVI_49935 [Pitangus sulphuratus]|nr:hypothetical protein BTVI_49935 [Pitangus sulphuratus]